MQKRPALKPYAQRAVTNELLRATPPDYQHAFAQSVDDMFLRGKSAAVARRWKAEIPETIAPPVAPVQPAWHVGEINLKPLHSSNTADFSP